MIRSIVHNDTAALLALAKAALPFEPTEIEELSNLLEHHFDPEVKSRDFWFVDDDNGLVSVAYVAPERMTQGTWNLYLIAVHPDRQQQGRGTAILLHVEQMLAKRGERLLLVETAGTDDFEYVRAFYRQNGYTEEAKIRNFYVDGVDKIVFCKQLNDRTKAVE
jgi:ribosomal protein S18 acetylase RimI-like enzyme